jgi:sugar lactone lactonase YvrE
MRLGVRRAVTATVVVVGLGALAAPPAPASEGPGGDDASTVVTLDPSTHGNPEGVAVDERTNDFFVGAVGDGTIYRGTVGDPTATEFIPGAAGRSSVGMKAADGLLYVAGGGTGAIRVYDIDTRNVVAEFQTGSGGFINDLVVTGDGDVFATDSFRPMLWHVTADQVAAGSGTPAAIPVDPEIVFQDGFNLNGIVAFGEDTLVVVQANTGNLYKIVLADDGGRAIQQIDVESLPGGDGLLVDQGRLLVVQGGEAPALNFVKLRGGNTRGEVQERLTDLTLRGSSTVARVEDRYAVVNADFATGTTPFTVSLLPR